jgi:hypothetical protein
MTDQTGASTLAARKHPWTLERIELPADLNFNEQLSDKLLTTPDAEKYGDSSIAPDFDSSVNNTCSDNRGYSF